MLTRNNFDNMDEADLRVKVLIPLLRAMEYKDVFEYHGGAGEQGKDIVCWKPDALGSRENLAVVAKATQMTGQAKIAKGAAGEVQTQIRQCFGSNYTDPVTTEQQQVHYVWVMSSKRISKETEDAISSAVASPALMRHVKFVDGDRLWKLVEQYLPISILHYVDEARKAAQSSDSHYEPHILIAGDQTTITVKEKYPGAAEEKPFTINTKFVSQEAADEFYAKLKHYQETGEHTDIPADLIESVELPDFVHSLFGIKSNQYKLSFVPPPMPESFPIKLTVLCDDGEQYTRDYIVMKGMQVGTKAATIVSEERDVPFCLTLELRQEGDTEAYNKAHFVVEAREAPYNAVQYWEWLRLNTCLGKPCRILIDSVENGFTFLEAQQTALMTEVPPTKLVEFYGRLATIQQKTKTPIIVSKRDITRGEGRLIERIYEIVTVGRMEGTWNHFSGSFVPDPKFISSIIANYAGEHPGVFVAEQEETVTIFDTLISLGRVRTTLYNVALKNAIELIKNRERIQAKQATIELKFESLGEGKSVSEYFEWLPSNLRPQSLIRQASTVAG